MNCKRIILLFFVISLYFLSCTFTEAVNTLSYCGQPKTWVEAKQFCELKGGRLMNRLQDNDDNFLRRTDIPTKQHIWFGQYRGLSGWREYIGCFNQRSLGVSWYSITTEDNSAATCQNLCNKTNYFALQGALCLCSYNNFVNTSWLNPESNCFTKCPGNQSEICGGAKSMTIYHKVQSDLIQYDPDSYPHLQCAMMNCSSSTNWTYHEHECDNNLTALCEPGVVINQTATWFTSRSLCKSRGSSLIGLNSMVRNCPFSGNIKQEFWIGVYRSPVDLMLKDTNIQNPVFGCYSILKQSSTSTPVTQFFPIEICEKQNRFPFVCELPPGYSSFDGCYLPPTTTTSTSTTTRPPELLEETDDNGLRIGLYVALGIVILAAVIVVLLLFARKKSGREPFRRNEIMSVIRSINRRRKAEGNHAASPQQQPETGKMHSDIGKPEYAVVNKLSRRQSAPVPSPRVNIKPVTALKKVVEKGDGKAVSNGSYDTIDTTYKRQEQTAEHTNDNQLPSILKSSDNNGSIEKKSLRNVIIEDYNRNVDSEVPRSLTLRVPKKIIPVPPPTIKYPLDHHGNSYEQIGTTLL